ncbi:MAG: phosphogluconate dehydratase, partial [Flavobacteriales bacterium]|nr:phosphogluconate dehydratase [Flavobacteriales bacterium]
MNKSILNITNRIIERSVVSRAKYLAQINNAQLTKVTRAKLSCGNLAHAFASCNFEDKASLKGEEKVNIGIINSYNDMLSAHKPYENYPEIIRSQAATIGAVAQVAAGVPAMCDGVTQGQMGMELSLLSRDVIALSTAIGLSHNMFDAGLFLGICDKIVPGMLIGALRFGHLPCAFIPGGPMPTGISNDEKAEIRKQYALGEISKKELLDGESAAYHSPGTCTFYGTANSNQMLMEIMGLHLPGASFVPPNTELRHLLTQEAVKVVAKNARLNQRKLADIISEKTIVNGMIGLLATGGSTNHTLHLIAIAAAAGIHITLDDFSDLSAVVPLLSHVYPNGKADVNQFHSNGGMSFIVSTLIENGLIHRDVPTIVGENIDDYMKAPSINDTGKLEWNPISCKNADSEILRTANRPFSDNGGIKVLKGNLGTAVIKTSAVAKNNRNVTAPAVVYEDQETFVNDFKKGKLNKDFVAVIKFQGPKANGMPELHQLTPMLSILQNQGYKVALVTDGRMSGASGKVPAAIHLSPEAIDGGPLSKIKNGDVVQLNAETGALNVKVTDEEMNKRMPAKIPILNEG